MKYAKYKDEILEIHGETDAAYVACKEGDYCGDTAIFISKSHVKQLERVIKIADSMDELFDAFVAVIYDEDGVERHKYYSKDSDNACTVRWQIGKLANAIYGAIWTDKGLKYVAKMNEEGELELL